MKINKALCWNNYIVFEKNKLIYDYDNYISKNDFMNYFFQSFNNNNNNNIFKKTLYNDDTLRLCGFRNIIVDLSQ
jgi:2-hydroxy-3-keto-5-methylthiopentenyl-1-phosphate phosphatase